MKNDDYIKYLTELISFKTITPYGQDALAYIENLFLNQGFKSYKRNFGKNDYTVTNLYLFYGNESPNICFAGHVDVVPPGDVSLWISDPFKALTKSGKIYGRGAVDMKGAIACMMSSVFSFLKIKPKYKGSISLLLTTDEEGRANYGTKKMIKYIVDKGHKPDLVIIGEPTSERKLGDFIKIGRRGSINFTLIIKGRQGHVGYPNLANNPIHSILLILQNLISFNIDQGNKYFQSSTLQITSIDVGNDIVNVIPSYAQARFNIRFNNLHAPSNIIQQVRDIIEKFSVKYYLKSEVTADAFLQKENFFIKTFINNIYKTLGVKSIFSTSGGTSDARFIKDYCTVLEFGLKMQSAHAINEYVEIKDLQRLHSVYYNFLCETLK